MCVLAHSEKSRVIVTTDIGGTDSDDEQSMVHLLMCSNDLDIEGIVCQMAFVKTPIGIGALNKIIDAYAIVEENLRLHDPEYPTANYLRAIAKTGQTEVGMAGVGDGFDSPGSDLIISSVKREDDTRPIWLLAWGGTNTIAQALWRLRATEDETTLNKILGRIRIYDVLGQCDAGAWIAHDFPEITYIRARDVYGWAPDDEWTKINIQDVGPLGRAYPNRKWATEGDSPSFMHLIDNGLNLPDDVSAGGWGGRFSKDKAENIEGMSWVKRNNLDEMRFAPYLMHCNPEGEQSVGKWSEDIRNDFAARMQWTINDYGHANHHPRIRINNESRPSTDPIRLKIAPGETFVVDASESFDPDGDKLYYSMHLYKEVSGEDSEAAISDNGEGRFTVRLADKKLPDRLHFIVEVTDNATPPLKSYRRIIVENPFDPKE
ncbi:MAG: DUF1593 domain-containing protein [Clostridium sp.]|nr:DUF1593 domain-containing protein [Clostridium sp.]